MANANVDASTVVTYATGLVLLPAPHGSSATTAIPRQVASVPRTFRKRRPGSRPTATTSQYASLVR